jgi:hypothetical protein
MTNTTPAPGADKATDEQIEAAAKAIYPLFPFADAHPWIEGGNSFKQDDARRYARAALVAGAPAQPDPKLVLALPDYEKRRIVIASDEVIDGERLVCVAIEDAAASITVYQHALNDTCTVWGDLKPVEYESARARGDVVRVMDAAPVSGEVVARPDLAIEQEPKYGGALFNRASGESIPADEPVFIFRARDWYSVNVLAHYGRMLPDGAHRAAVWARVADFKAFAAEHPDRMKEPDTALQAPQAPDTPTGEKK